MKKARKRLTKKGKKAPRKRLTKKGKKAPPRGNRKMPHLAVAVLCEKVLQEKDNVVSVIRVVDKVTITAADRSLPAATIACHIFLMFKSGDARGPRQLRIVGSSPSGEEFFAVERQVDFVGDEHGVYIDIAASIRLKETGLYWFDIMVGRQSFTKIPLRIAYHRQKEK